MPSKAKERVDKQTKRIIELMTADKSLKQEDAVALLLAEEAKAVPIEDRTTGGDPVNIGQSFNSPEAEEAAIRQPLPEVPEQAGGQRNMRLLELIGNIGTSFAQNRAVGKANEQTGSRQANANLINTLRGSPTASVAPVEANEGILGTLARGLGGAGRTMRESREAEAASGQAGFENEVKNQQLGISNMNALTNLMGKRGKPGDDEVKMNNKLYRRQADGSLKMILDASDPKAPPVMKSDDGTVFEYDFDAVDDTGNKGAWVKIFDPKAPDIKDLTLLFEERGRQFSTMEGFLAADETMAAILNDPSANDIDRGGLRGAFIKGNREQKEAFEKALTKRMGSASERLTMAEAIATGDQLDDILKLFASAEITGMKFNIMNMIGVGFDPEENPLTQGFLRVYKENSTQLADTLAGFTVNIARIINGGRPSDADAKAARRLLPLQGEVITPIYKDGVVVGYGGLAGRKIMFLKMMFQRRLDAIRQIVSEGGDPSHPKVAADSYLREAENFLLESSLRPEMETEAAVLDQETGVSGSINFNSNVGAPD